MLAADKLQLKTSLKQQATALKEKEFKLHHENLRTVGTQAAVLAGLDITMLIELSPSLDSEWIMSTVESHYLHYLPRVIKFFYYITIVSAFCANIFVVGQTTVLSVMGASLALRGPDGSMMHATDGLYDERNTVFRAFAYGLGSTLVSVILGLWLIIPPEAAFVCMVCTCCTARIMKNHYTRIKEKFIFNEEDTVDFTDLFDGQGNFNFNESKSKRGRKKKGGAGILARKGQDHNRHAKYSPSPSINLDSSDSEDKEDVSYYNQTTTRRRNMNGKSFHGGKSDYDYEDSSQLITV
jgi:hypothetical protein